MKKKLGLILGSIVLVCILIGTEFAVSAEGPDLQEQINILNQKIGALEKRVSNLETYSGMVQRGNYTLIASFTGSSGVTTDYFYLGKTDIRLNWTWTSRYSESSIPVFFGIYLYKESTNQYVAGYSNLGPNGTTYFHGLWAERYYITTSAGNLDRWHVTVEAWVPE